MEPDADEPSLGGTLNATTEQAQHDKEQELEADRNKKILTHSTSNYVSSDEQPAFQAPFNAAGEEEKVENQAMVDIFKEDLPPVLTQPEPAAPAVAPPTETLEDIDKKNRAQAHAEAQDAVAMAYEATPIAPAVPVPAPQVEEPAPTPVEQAVEEQAAPVSPAPYVSPEALPPVTAPAPVDFSQLPPPPPLPNFPQGPLPPEQLGQIFGTPPAAPPPPTPASPPDPNQFKIPGQ